jgi:nitric oxide reductase activation protein
MNKEQITETLTTVITALSELHQVVEGANLSGIELSDTEMAVIQAMRGQTASKEDVEEKPKKTTRKRRTKKEIEEDNKKADAEPLVEEKIEVAEGATEKVNVDKPAKKKELKPDENVPTVPEEVNKDTVRFYAGQYLRYLDNDKDFANAINSTFKDSEVGPLSTLTDENAEKALEIVQTVVDKFTAEQKSNDEDVWG